MPDTRIIGSARPAGRPHGGEIAWRLAKAAGSASAFLGLVAGFMFCTAELGGRIRLAGGTMDERAIPVTIAGRHYAIPGNAIRFQGQRAGGALAELDLYLSWPHLAGLTEETRGLFHSPASPDLIFLGLSESDAATEARPPSDERPLSSVVAGLRQMARAGGPTSPGELVFVTEKQGSAGYRVSCLDRNTAGDVAADCIRQVTLAPGMKLTYRFSQTILPQWQRIEAGLIGWLDRHAVR